LAWSSADRALFFRHGSAIESTRPATLLPMHFRRAQDNPLDWDSPQSVSIFDPQSDAWFNEREF